MDIMFTHYASIGITGCQTLFLECRLSINRPMRYASHTFDSRTICSRIHQVIPIEYRKQWRICI